MTQDTQTSSPARQTVRAKDYPIRQVVVYSDRAEVSRPIRGLTLQSGRNEVELVGLPSTLHGDTIRVETPARVVILDVSHRQVTGNSLLEQEQSDEEAALHSEIHRLESRLEKQEKELGRLRLDNELLEAYTRTFTNPGVHGKQTVQEQVAGFQAFAQFYADHGRELSDKELKINNDIEETKQKLILARNKVKKPQLKDQESSFSITIVLETEEAVEETEIRLSYVVFGASWTSRYDVRVRSDSQQLELDYMAEVIQKTGEPWENVRMRLSTAMPSLQSSIPTTVKPWVINLSDRQGPGIQRQQMQMQMQMQLQQVQQVRAQPRTIRGRNAPPPPPPPPPAGGMPTEEGEHEDVESMDDLYSISEAPQPAAMHSGMVAAFEITADATVPSDNESHRVTIAVLDLKAKFVHTTFPKIASSHVYLKAYARNESDMPLFAGPCNIYVDGSYVTKSSIQRVSPSERFTCPLGADPSVTVTYPDRRKQVTTGGFIAKVRTQKFEQVIRVHNGRTQPILLQVFDQTPISHQERVRIQLIEPSDDRVIQAKSNESGRKSRSRTNLNPSGSPSAEEANPDLIGPISDARELDLVVTGPRRVLRKNDGLLTWTLGVRPAQTEAIHFVYEVSYSEDESVQGL